MFDDLCPGVIINQRTAKDKKRGMTIGNLMIDRISEQMRFADTSRTRDQRSPAVDQSPAIAGYPFDDGIQRLFEPAHIMVQISDIVSVLGWSRIDIANGAHGLCGRHQGLAS